MRLSRLLTGVAILLPLALVGGCGPATIDVAAVIKVGNLTTGWFDVGITNGMNKLVPSASFTVTNSGAEKLSALQVFSVFRFQGEEQELGSALIVLHGQDALGPSATSKPITVRGNWGFSGLQPRAQMLAHREFRDARVQIFAKYGTGQFVKLTEAVVTRQLITH